MLARGYSLLYSLLVFLGLGINFPESECFCFLGMFWDTVNMSLSLPADKHLGFSSWHFLCCRCNLLQSIRSCLLRQGHFLSKDMQNFIICDMIQSEMFYIYDVVITM